MRLTLSLTMLLCLAVPATAAELNYSLYVLGVPVADAVLNVEMEAYAYRITLRFHTTGLASVVASDRMELRARGVFESDRPAPLDYASNGRRHGQDQLVGLTWRDDTPIVTAISPPNETEREEVPMALRARTVDPMSSFVQLLRTTSRKGRCEGATRGFDGRMLELFEARTVGEESLPSSSRSSFSGHALRCDFTQRTLAGFRLGSGRDDDARQRGGTVWLSQPFPGSPPLPVRASMETKWLGTATIYLTSVSP